MNETKLIIDRVVIKSNAKKVYDQIYHHGINVIRGDNGTGKSTIVELISYGLGGDIKKNNWKKEALECTEILISLKLRNKPYVFKRAIEEESSKPQIKIFEGTYDKSLKTSDEWLAYKNRKSDVRKSYSMQIFELLGLESHITADDDSLTMHQLLRVLYIDQDTPASKIFRTESFSYDSDSMRKSIGEYTFGFDNLEAHTLRQRLYLASKKFDKIDSELKTFYKVLQETQITATKIEVESEIQKLQDDLTKVNRKREDSQNVDLKLKSEETRKRIITMQKDIDEKVRTVSDLKSELNLISYDISESTQFIESLKQRKSSLQKATLIYSEVGVLSYQFCPSCMAKITTDNDKSHCYLCKSPSSDERTNETYIQALNELDFQLTETTQVLAKRTLETVTIESTLSSLNETIIRLKDNLREINSYSNDYEVTLSQLASEKGFIEAQIENLKERLSLATKLDKKVQEKVQLQTEMNDVEGQLDQLLQRQKRRINKVKKLISAKVIKILAKDEGREKAFSDAKKFEFDFGSDSIRLDGRANFSASSNVILKNAFHLSVLLTSLKDNEFRIPCFSMFDNIEDKGMTTKRSQNFQKILSEMCEDEDEGFQIIMTTSMVASKLNSDEYGVGPYYEKGMHTLDM